MTLYKICEWEDNGFNDSDFLMGVYDDETEDCTRHLIGSTRFSGMDYPEMAELTPKALKGAIKWLSVVIYRHLKISQIRAIEDAQDAPTGTHVILTVKHRNRPRVSSRSPCRKCKGSGWFDEGRLLGCFTCGGKGDHKGEGFVDKERFAPKGTPMILFEPGLRGVSEGSRAYGTFYANGYSKPGRNNTTVYVRLADGRLLRCPMEKLRIDMPIKSDDLLQGEAWDKAQLCGFAPYLGCKAWTSSNEAADLAAKLIHEKGSIYG